MKIPVLILTGPTAVGKTDLSISLAKKINAEIISADSMQIYKKMDIGSAKIKEDEKEGVAHYLIDIVDPDDDFSVSEFRKMALEKIEDIHSRNKKIIITGGTGLYLNSIIYEMDFANVNQNPKLRKSLQKEYEKYGATHMYERLKSLQPDVASEIHPNNVKRVIRALEIAEMGGHKSSFKSDLKKNEKIDADIVVLNREREILYDRINKRVDIMIEEGLVEEVKTLLKSYSRNLVSMQGIGYKEIAEFLYSEIPFNDAVEKIKMGTRRYAKRQITWFKRYNPALWIDMDKNNTESALKIILDYIK